EDGPLGARVTGVAAEAVAVSKGGAGDLGGALEENCGSHLTAVLLTDGSQVCIVYDARPEAVPCAVHSFPSLRRFLTRRTCLLAQVASPSCRDFRSGAYTRRPT